MSAKIPSQEDLALLEAVFKHFTHRPRTQDSNTRCLRDEKFSKRL